MGATDALRLAKRLGLHDPGRVAAVAGALGRWGPTIATLYRAGALRHPLRPAVIDHRGALDYIQLDRRSSALAKGLRAAGLQPAQRLGLLCFNHRDFVEANVAAAKAGLDVVYLNTGFAGPQLADVIERENIAGLVVDAALHALVADIDFAGPQIIADEPANTAPSGHHTMRDARRLGRSRSTTLIPRASSPVLLTSGTTGLPKGANRADGAGDPRAAGGIFQAIPYRTGDVFCLPTPLFHAWGLSQLLVAASLGSTVLLAPRFSPTDTVRSVVEHRATVLAVVPVMLQRLLAEPDLDLSQMTSLRIVASSGSALPGPVSEQWMDRTGDTLYNLYGSTEVGQATIATPADLRAAPGTAGRVAPGCDVAIVDHDGQPLPNGAEGRIFVANGSQFSGYTGGGTKEIIDGRMASGDVGHFDEDDRLFVTGRADDMIVSGGENVFPGEVEDALLADPRIADAAVVGVPDPSFGQRLAAFVVRAPGASVSSKAVKEVVATELARHKVPRDVTFVDELPRTTTGKLLRRSLTG
ncbi:MAG: AMP-binding protein [Acidimicrobiales bacterium]